MTPEQHFTQPPPRYTEATLVKRMEELGIGRPSTYASIVSTIQERDYVRKDKNRLVPEDKGRLVTAFLANYFGRYVDYDFTADLEEDLDRVTTGDEDWKALLARFWRDFSAALGETEGLRIGEVLEKINEVLEPHLFPGPPRTPSPAAARSAARAGSASRPRATARRFIGCSNYPECRYTRPLAGEVEGGDAAGPDGKLLGARRRTRPPAGDAARRALRPLRPARRGARRARSPSAPRSPRAWTPRAIDLERALELLVAAAAARRPPRGRRAGRGRHRPLRPLREARQDLRQPPRPRGGLTIGMNRAVELLAQKSQRGRPRRRPRRCASSASTPTAARSRVYEGRYGPYVKWEKVNATLPKDVAPETLTLEQALELIAAKKPAGKKAPPPRPLREPASTPEGGTVARYESR